MEEFNKKLVDILENHNTKLGKFIGSFLIGFILLTSITFILEDIPKLSEYKYIFKQIDTIILTIFLLEYLLRLLISKNKLKFIFSFFGIIDLLVIIPLFGIIPQLSFLRNFRLLEILRIMKIIRYSVFLQAFIKSFRHYKNEIKIFVLVFFVIISFSAFGIFYIESGINPEFSNMADAFWWSFVTISTVGYGDITPITGTGKILGSITIFAGLANIAIMTAIITKVFLDHFFGKRNHKCFACSFPNHDHDAKFCKNCGSGLNIELLHKSERTTFPN